MIENYLGYMEICMQLYINQNGNKKTLECLQKYEIMLNDEYEKLSEEEKEILKELISSKIKNAKMEKSTIMLAQSLMLKDSQLKSIFPGHIKAQYSDKLKKNQQEIHYLESINRIINNPRGMTR